MNGRISIYVTIASVVLAVVITMYLLSSASSVVASPNNMMRDHRGSDISGSSNYTTTASTTTPQQEPSGLQNGYGMSDGSKVLTVNGFGQIYVMPDTVSINIGIETVAETSRDAVAENSEIVNRVIEALKAHLEDEKDIRTSYFSIYPQYKYHDDGTPPTIVGYQASNTINVLTRKVEKVAEMIDSAVSAGANRVDGPWYSISPELQKQYREQVIGIAMRDAEDNARVILAMQGLAVKGIKSIVVNFNGQPIAVLGEGAGSPLYGGRMLAEAYYPPPVIPGEQQITATVTVVYEVGEQ